MDTLYLMRPTRPWTTSTSPSLTMALQKLHASAKYYNRFMLRVYDFFVLCLFNHFWWRCPTATMLLPFFKAHIGTDTHLRIGVGTGHYPVYSLDNLRTTRSPSRCTWRPSGAGYAGELQTLEHDVFEPLPATLNGQFDSVLMFYLFHCLPGSFRLRRRRRTSARTSSWR